MNEIVQHVPTFVDGVERKRATFTTLEELLAVPWVKNYADSAEEFHQFSVSGQFLLVESRGGKHWWVVGVLKEPVAGLPAWGQGIYEVWDENGKELDVSGRDVEYSQGDVVALHDGRKLRRRG
jgi:hypothetical protein